MFDLDIRQLEQFNETLERFEERFPTEAKKMLQKVGNKSKAIVAKTARQLVKNESGRAFGRYNKSIKRGKVWDENGQLVTRVYSTDPKKFLIENGHRIVDKKGNEHGFKPGYKVFDRSAREIEQNFIKIVTTELNKTFERL